MVQRLVIVESPSKARTLARFLDNSYTIRASMGHIRDLPKSTLGVDVEAGFKPQYEVIKGKEKQIRELRELAKQSDEVLLAADPDREGEAIAWHLAEALKLRNPERIVFHEVTRPAVEEALAHPRQINRSLVFAQEARRVIDRLVGYRLSPLLWKKVRTGLSAGRVQSVAVRLVCEREAEIEAFQAEESWTIDLQAQDGDGKSVVARLVGRVEKGETSKLELHTEGEVEQVFTALGADADGVLPPVPTYRVTRVERSEVSRSAAQPYTTSTMQQDASTRLRFSPKRTMMIAQELYEGVDIGAGGQVGLITYMRTDSTRISDLARDDTRRFIEASYGEEYVRKGSAKGKASPLAQDAHEAIRPTDVTRTPESVASFLSGPQQRLYDLVWRRFVASQMAPAKFARTVVTVAGNNHEFRATGTVPVFDGFNRVWKREEEKEEQDESGTVQLPALVEGQELVPLQLSAEQHFTQPPPRYTEASLIKDLEERGIGRPSTYAPTIDTIEARGYVRSEERRLYPTEVGKTVDSVLRQHFPDIVDIDFTAALEKKLDALEEGEQKYEVLVADWYGPFQKTVEKAEAGMERVRIPARDTGETCPLCGEGTLVMREGRYGPFTGCSRYPECKYIKGKEGSGEQVGENCPDCGKPLITRQGKRGPFIGCSGYPACRYVRAAAGQERQTVEPTPTGENCPDCGKPLVERPGRFGPFVACSGYPKCRYRPPKVGAADKSSPASATGKTAGTTRKKAATRPTAKKPARKLPSKSGG